MFKISNVKNYKVKITFMMPVKLKITFQTLLIKMVTTLIKD